MYARTDYPTHKEDLQIPQNYGGNALSDSPEITDEIRLSCKTEDKKSPEIPISAPTQQNPWEYVPKEDVSPPPKKETASAWSPLSLFQKFPAKGWFDKIPFLSDLTGLLQKDDGKKSPLESSEDTLLLIVAIFLFFSSGGDKICALVLLALLFLT